MSSTIWFNANIHPSNATECENGYLATCEVLNSESFEGEYSIEYDIDQVILPNGTRLGNASNRDDIVELLNAVKAYRGDGEYLGDRKFRLNSIRIYGSI
jgi:hypothetical protein